jgi:hypothetical protein
MTGRQPGIWHNPAVATKTLQLDARWDLTAVFPDDAAARTETAALRTDAVAFADRLPDLGTRSSAISAAACGA